MPDAAHLLGIAVLGTYAWRGLGVLVAGRVDEESPLFAWITCVAYAIATGLMMKIVLLPGGALLETHLIDRLAGLAASVGVFYLGRKNLLAGLGAGVGAFLLLPYLRSLSF